MSRAGKAVAYALLAFAALVAAVVLVLGLLSALLYIVLWTVLGGWERLLANW
ncbi:hypothetical protein NLX83_39820 [Allokutzneria sp. A3M-2-11 16]|uniref:hypothetical protein n=1 Tax=Allokutzneria sp. A3M-2-11 16 TaxID=2962043 RepID=UPI0020B82E74|nr:hypothetical protein [Allokutzneria sp. A3M-2-11 16]MCP3805434.1 hypothetical protein [Allokutzneria sp. A3M-2-11 16]